MSSFYPVFELNLVHLLLLMLRLVGLHVEGALLVRVKLLGGHEFGAEV